MKEGSMSNIKTHYVYLLISLAEDKYYIGSRTCTGSPEDDLYMGSSSIMTVEDKENCDKLVLREFSTREEAINYEVRLHGQFNVKDNENFWNVANQTSTKFDTTGRVASAVERQMRSESQLHRYKLKESPLKGRKQSKEHVEKCTITRVGKRRSEITKSNISKKVSGFANGAFRPWWFIWKGETVEVHDITIKEYAETVFKVKYHILKDRFRKEYIGKEKKTEPLKGIIVGVIND